MDLLSAGSSTFEAQEIKEVNNKINELMTDVWFKKYMPETIDDAILPSGFKTALLEEIKAGKVSNYTFAGKPGSGKTMTAEIIARSLGIRHPKIINASKDKQLNVIDTEIMSYANEVSNEKHKVIIIDEIGALQSDSFMQALKGVMNDLMGDVIFLLTTNHLNKVEEGVIKRTQLIDFDAKKEVREIKTQMYHRLRYIAEQELGVDAINTNGVVKDECKDALVNIVEHYYPNVRSMIVALKYNAAQNSYTTIKGAEYVVVDMDIHNIYTHLANYDFDGARKQYGECVSDVQGFIAPFINYGMTLIPNNLKFHFGSICAKWHNNILSQVDSEIHITCGLFAEIAIFFQQNGIKV